MLSSKVAQELNLVEREPNYVNPYAKENHVREDPHPGIPEKKKARRRIDKGPSLSGSRLKSELWRSNFAFLMDCLCSTTEEHQ